MRRDTTTRRRLLRGIAGTGLAFGAVGVGSASPVRQYIVTGGSTRRLNRAGYTVTRELAGGSVRIVTAPEDAESNLKSVSGVSGVTPNFEVNLPEPVGEANADTTEDAAFTDLQWDKKVTDTFEAHDIATGSGRRIVIADTGVSGTHPDLQNLNTDLSVSFTNGDGTRGPYAGDSSYHGTHVAGIAAATGAQGVTGVAPDAELVSVQVLDNGGSFADILAGADYAADIGADVANFSLGADPFPPQANSNGLRVAVQKVMQNVARRGTVTTASAGNNDANLQQGGFFYLPGTVQGVMTISATGPNDELAFYSNYGTNQIEVGAPGGGYETEEKTYAEQGTEWPYPTNLVYSTLPLDEGAYGYLAGTSMSSPQVAGLVGLVRETNPDANTNQIENAIAQGAELAKGRSSPELGAGRINVLNTVSQGGSPGRGNARARSARGQ
jgi:subtilisin family serine protease